MKDKDRNAGNLDLLGGRLCLDFVNTVDWRGRATPQEFLNTYLDLLLWAQHVNILTSLDAKALTQMAKKNPSGAITVMDRAKHLREALFRIFVANFKGVTANKVDLALFNKELSLTMSQSRIVNTANGFSWDTTGNKQRLDWILNPIVRCAADILVSSEIKRVKICADAECGWLFVDSARNRSRRWCDMSDCGNRAKASRFYERKKSGKSGTPLSKS